MIGLRGLALAPWDEPDTSAADEAALLAAEAQQAQRDADDAAASPLAALRAAAVAAMPADLGALLAAAPDALALLEASDVVAWDARCGGGWWGAFEALTDGACAEVRRSGALPTWWDAGHTEAADRHAAAVSR